MVQMVFVHGVANRSGPAYDAEESNRDTLFKEMLFAGASLDIRAPRWGDLVPAIKGAAFAGTDGVGSFGIFGGAVLGLDAAAEGSLVSDLAAKDPDAALDAIFATIVEQADGEGRLLGADDIAAFRQATAAIDPAAGAPSLLPTASDEELVFQIHQALPAGSYSLGIGSRVKSAVAALADRARNNVSTALSNAFRDQLNPLVGRFLGDIFVYLRDGDLRESVRKCVREPILEADAEAKASGEPLILIGHSLGGVILYDMLSEPHSAGLPDDLDVNLFMTVGSQPGLFEEMGLFDFKHSGLGPTPGPASVKSWFNVLDPIDVFGFRATPMFDKAEDFVFDSVTGLISAHTAYFKRPLFHARARARLHGLGLI